MSTRLIALGASNLARGMGSAVAVACETWGPQVEVVGAFGPGRSYGMPSSLVGRTLPGILECGVWSALDGLPPARTRALVTDVGNDILYHVPVPRIVSWVDEAVARLGALTDDGVITGLPLARIRLLSPSSIQIHTCVSSSSMLTPDRCRSPLRPDRTDGRTSGRSP